MMKLNGLILVSMVAVTVVGATGAEWIRDQYPDIPVPYPLLSGFIVFILGVPTLLLVRKLQENTNKTRNTDRETHS